MAAVRNSKNPSRSAERSFDLVFVRTIIIIISDPNELTYSDRSQNKIEPKMIWFSFFLLIFSSFDGGCSTDSRFSVIFCVCSGLREK